MPLLGYTASGEGGKCARSSLAPWDSAGIQPETYRHFTSIIPILLVMCMSSKANKLKTFSRKPQ